MKDEAIALCRVSTIRQRLEGSSLEAQEQRVYEAADYINAEIVKFWSLNISSRKGKNYNRKDLTEMLAYAKQHKKVKFCIIDEIDRFMRDFDVYYYWKVVFREQAGVKLVYAKKPHLAFEDNMATQMEEMMDVFRAEASNRERITKTTSNMQARVNLGYYPGKNKPGYKKTDTPGLFAPAEPEYSMLRNAFFDVLKGSSIKDVVLNLNTQGYLTVSGNKLDAFNFRKMLKDPYYAGILVMSNWKVNPNGLHKAMITKEQHEQIISIVDGMKYKPHKKFNEEFRLSNLMECTECLAEHSLKSQKIVGFNHNNGKKGASRKYYKRYKCRGCGALILQKELHKKLTDELLGLNIASERYDEFMSALRVVWEEDSSNSILRSGALQRRIEQLVRDKSKLIRQSLNSTLSEGDVKIVLDEIDSDIADVEKELREIGEIENDFVDFVDFSIETVDNMRTNFWELDAEHLGWCKQLLFPEGFSVSRDKKVYTPKISDFYRLISNQKDPEGSSESNMVGPGGFEPPTSTTSMWRSSQMS
ncbi:MAG: site-specific recombinase [Patescibacteria group bacterium]|nr:site-specific recombinase [Patescibacteria group bacterium]